MTDPHGGGPGREDAQRAEHLARVCAGLPTTISVAGARRLARMFTGQGAGEA